MSPPNCPAEVMIPHALPVGTFANLVEFLAAQSTPEAAPTSVLSFRGRRRPWQPDLCVAHSIVFRVLAQKCFQPRSDGADVRFRQTHARGYEDDAGVPCSAGSNQLGVERTIVTEVIGRHGPTGSGPRPIW